MSVLCLSVWLVASMGPRWMHEVEPRVTSETTGETVAVCGTCWLPIEKPGRCDTMPRGTMWCRCED